jgi:hypothetical protein
MSNRQFYRLTALLLGTIASIFAGGNSALAGGVAKGLDLSLQSPFNNIVPEPGNTPHPKLPKIGFRETFEEVAPSQKVAVKQYNTPAKPDLGLGVTARVGTLGIGLEATKSIIPQLNARLGVNFGNVGFNRTDSGIQYDSKLELSSVNLFGDYYPIGGSNFRVSGGLVSQNNQFSVTSIPQGGSYTINNTTYAAADVGTLRGNFKYANTIAPYLGIGFGQPTNDGLGFNFDLGIMFTGSPKVSLTADNPNFTSIPGAQAELDAQITKTENELKGFNVYPVLSVGVSYGF